MTAFNLCDGFIDIKELHAVRPWPLSSRQMTKPVLSSTISSPTPVVIARTAEVVAGGAVRIGGLFLPNVNERWVVDCCCREEEAEEET